jgi:hypothetical protein
MVYCQQFDKTTNFSQYPSSIGYDEKYKDKPVYTKFLGLHIDNLLNWKNHIYYMIPKLYGTCYAVKPVFYISNTDTLKTIYFCLFALYIAIWNILCGKLPYSKEILTLQNKIFRLMVGTKTYKFLQGVRDFLSSM